MELRARTLVSDRTTRKKRVHDEKDPVTPEKPIRAKRARQLHASGSGRRANSSSPREQQLVTGASYGAEPDDALLRSINDTIQGDGPALVAHSQLSSVRSQDLRTSASIHPAIRDNQARSDRSKRRQLRKPTEDSPDSKSLSKLEVARDESFAIDNKRHRVLISYPSQSIVAPGSTEASSYRTSGPENSLFSGAVTKSESPDVPVEQLFEEQVSQLEAHYRSLQRLRYAHAQAPRRLGPRPSDQAPAAPAESWEDRLKRLKEQDRRAAAEQAARIRDNRERGQQGLLRSLKSVRQWTWPRE